MKASPIELVIPNKGPLAWLAHLGFFETTTLLLLIGALVHYLWKKAPCYSCPSYPTYAHTGKILLGMFILYPVLAVVQAAYLSTRHLPNESASHWQTLRWLFLRAMTTGFPFLVMLLSLVALPAYRAVYLMAGIFLYQFDES